MNISAAKENAPSGLARNFFWMSWSGVVSIANSVLIWIFMARLRDVDEVGRFAVVMGLYALFFNVVSLGLLPYLINEISRGPAFASEDKPGVFEFVTSAHAFLLLSGILSACLMTAAGFFVSSSWAVRLSAMALSLAMLPTGLLVVCEATAVARGRAGLVAAVSTIENVLRTVIPIALLWSGFDMVVVCLSFTAIRFVALFTYVAAKGIPRPFTFSGVEFRRLFSVFPTFAGTIFFASVTWQAGLVLLGYLGTESESALFGTASRFLIPVSILVASYASVIQPAIARNLAGVEVNPGRYLSRIMRLPLLAAAFAALCTPFLSGPVLALMFGEAYRASALTLDILVLSIIPFCMVMMAARGLVALGAQRIDLIANILGVVVCISAGAVLAPRYGAVGAATAQLLAFSAMAVLETVYLSRRLTGFRAWSAAAYSASSLAGLSIVLWKHWHV